MGGVSQKLPERGGEGEKEREREEERERRREFRPLTGSSRPQDKSLGKFLFGFYTMKKDALNMYTYLSTSQDPTNPIRLVFPTFSLGVSSRYICKYVQPEHGNIHCKSQTYLNPNLI